MRKTNRTRQYQYLLPVLLRTSVFLFALILFTVSHAFADGSWIPQETKVKVPITDIHFIDKDIGWAVGEAGIILYTSDGGNTWERRRANLGDISDSFGKVNSVSFYGVSFIDRYTGWIVGTHNVVLKTIDGGRTWVKQDVGVKPVPVGPILRDYDFFSIYFADKKNGWIVGFFGEIILHTEDGGYTWEIQKTGTNNVLRGIHFRDKKNGWAVGSHGTILRTRTGGNNRYFLFNGWEKQSDESYGDLQSVFFINENIGWAIGSNGALKTIDGGRNWNFKKLNISAYSLRSIFFVNEMEGWIAGWGGIFHTTDGGKNWTVELSGRNYEIIKVFFLDKNHGWATGGYGQIYRYIRDDSGAGK